LHGDVAAHQPAEFLAERQSARAAICWRLPFDSSKFWNRSARFHAESRSRVAHRDLDAAHDSRSKRTSPPRVNFAALLTMFSTAGAICHVRFEHRPPIGTFDQSGWPAPPPLRGGRDIVDQAPDLTSGKSSILPASSFERSSTLLTVWQVLAGRESALCRRSGHRARFHRLFGSISL
jgi:hypothetical protein